MDSIEYFKKRVSGDKKPKKVLVEKFEDVMEVDEKFFEEPSSDFMAFFDEKWKKVSDYLSPSIFEVSLDEKPNILISSQENIPPSYYDVKTGSIIINKNYMENEESLGLNITHEIIHFLSAQNIYVVEKKGKFLDTVFKKVGYSATRFDFDESTSENFRTSGQAFNEGLTEYLASGIYYGFNDEKMMGSYPYEVKLVRKIIENLDFDKEGDDNLMKFYKGYFEGGNMHLREIEKYYGEGSLKLLFSIKTLDSIKREVGEDRDKYIEYYNKRMNSLEFFITDDPKRREELRVRLLGNDK